MTNQRKGQWRRKFSFLYITLNEISNLNPTKWGQLHEFQLDNHLYLGREVTWIIGRNCESDNCTSNHPSVVSCSYLPTFSLFSAFLLSASLRSNFRLSVSFLEWLFFSFIAWHIMLSGPSFSNVHLNCNFLHTSTLFSWLQS